MLAGFFFRETRVLIVLLLVLVIGGLAALWTLGRQEDPTITNRYASVITYLPGAEPAVVEAQVSTVIEAQIKTLSGIDIYSSSSVRGTSIIGVTARDDLSADGVERLWTEIRGALERAQPMLPEAATPPQMETSGVTAYSTVIAVEMTTPSVSEAVAARFAEAVEARLRALPNTRAVRIYGKPEEEIAIRVDPFHAASMGVTLEHVASAVEQHDTPALAGELRSGGLAADLQMSRPLQSLDDLRDVPVSLATGGVPLRLAELADIRREIRTPPDTLARSSGNNAILIAAVIEDGAQIDRWMRFVRQDMDRLNAELPDGLRIEIVFDQSVYAMERLFDLGRSLALGIVIVFVVLLITLGLRAAAIVGMILPLVSFATLASFRFFDIPLHQMSLVGLIVALGLVVDAAIVTTDNVRRRLAEGEARPDAAQNAARRLFLPLAASTVTTILTFAPIFLLQGNVGDFIRTIAIAVSIMLFWSFLLAMAVTAPLAARLLPGVPQERGQSGRGRAFGIMQFLVQRPLVSLVLSAILPIAGFVALATLPVQFFPLADRNQFYISASLPVHADIARSADLAEQLDTRLREIEGIAQSYWVVGGTAPAFFYNILGGSTVSSNFTQGMITTDTAEDARRILNTLQSELSEAFPEAAIRVGALSQGPPVGAPITFLIYGNDLSELRRIGGEVQQAIAALPEAAQVSGGLADGAPQLRYAIDPTVSRLIGLNKDTIARQIRAGLSGVQAGEIVEGSQRLPLRVQFPAALQGNIEAISDIPLALGPDGSGAVRTVPLSSLAAPKLEITETLIYRYNGERMNFIRVFPRADVMPSELFVKARDAIRAADITLPPGYRIDTGGEDEQRDNTVAGLMASVALLAVLGFAMLVATFRSFRLTIGTLIVAGLSTGLSLLAVAVMGFPFGINALIGVIGSVGVSVNASIIIFTALQANDRAVSGDPDAIASEVIDGSRHIISTTLTTFGGFFPLMLQGGLFWPPFAAAVAGGVLLSGSLAYLFAPAYFRLFFARARAMASVPVEAAPTAEQPVATPEHVVAIPQQAAFAAPQEPAPAVQPQMTAPDNPEPRPGKRLVMARYRTRMPDPTTKDRRLRA